MRCLVCQETIEPQVTWENFWQVPEKEKLCLTCWKQMERIVKPGCPICFRNDDQGICPDCQKWTVTHEGVLEKNVSVFRYNDFARDVVARWKYRGDYVLMEAYKKDVSKAFHKYYSDKEPLVSIPLSEDRMIERGFNQSEAIIRLLGRESINLLEREGMEKQSKKQRAARIHSANPFRLTTSINEPIILIDDIYTTGTTLRHAASLLKQAGCPKVSAFTIFR
ncbi:ComF family protein [Halobacillus sp. BBL2006]|uniref:ComF family protein n=1 Tax=Halobacillus sp. BBL2006 TaxID=1543706 RepID=UPI0005425DAB|nr:ComF family protein [Halobacillus sp. BBL2006]KHE68132.1 competence protein ComFC [Halobacillus sp. BBL2006]